MLAREENLVDDIFSDLKAIEKALSENPEYMQFLSAPSISKTDRIGSVQAVFSEKISEYSLSFLQLLCEKGCIPHFSEIVSDFQNLREWASGTQEAVVRSAIKLSDAQEQKLVKALEKRTGKSVILKTVIDKSVLGGIIVEIDGEVIDGSVKTDLKHIKEVIGSE